MSDLPIYSAVRKPLLEASTLPGHCYVSGGFFKKEKQHIFSRCWHFVGRVDEISKAGEFLIVDTVAGSAIVCRDSGNRVHGFINSCRHRGTRLKDLNGRCVTFVCPYHAWSYSHEGQLVAAPGMDASNFNKEDFALHSVRLECWGGFIFINFDAAAPKLEEWLGDLPTVMRGHNPETLVCTKRLEFSIKANWKFLIENALEAYHTGTVHQETLGAQRSESIEAKGQWNALYVLNDDHKSIATLPGETQTFPFIPTLKGKSKNGTWFTVIYPCTQIVFSQDCVWWLDFKPISVNQTRLTIGGCFPAETVALDSFESGAAAYYYRWKTATEEDNAIAENQQRGHEAGVHTQGRFASTEHCVHALDNWVLNQLTGAGNA